MISTYCDLYQLLYVGLLTQSSSLKHEKINLHYTKMPVPNRQ